MKPRKSHRYTRSSSKGKSDRFRLRTLEQFFLNYGVGIAGAALLIIGLLYLFFNHFSSETFLTFIHSFLKPGQEENLNLIRRDFSVSVILSLSFLYFPGFIPLIVTSLLPSPKLRLKNSLILLGFLWLIFAQGKVFLYNAYLKGSFFPGYYSALIYFSIIQILLITFSALNKSRYALNLSVVFFFISVALIRSYFGGLLPFFVLLLFFQFSILFLSLKFRWRSPLLLSVLLSGCYLAYYILSKIIFPGNPLPVSYMLPSLLVWYVISIIGLAILKPTSGRNTISILWDSISYISPFLVIGSGVYVFKIFGIQYLSPLLYATAVIILVFVALLNERYDYLRSRRSFYFSICIFSASVIPQLLFSNFLLVFTASLSVTLLIHFHLTSSRSSYNLSKILFLVSMCLYVLEWAFSIFSALDDQRTSGEIYPFKIVLICLLITSISFFYMRFVAFAINEHRSLQKQRIIPENISGIFFPFIAYSTGFIVLDYCLINIFRGYRLNFIELTTYSYAFLWILFIRKQHGSRISLIIKTVLLFLAIILYPAIIHPEVIQFRNLYLEGNVQALVPFILHYFCLSLLILLLLQANSFLIQLFPRTSHTSHYIKLTTVILTTFILLTEYDNFSLLLFNRFSDKTAAEILRLNEIIPYSIILLLISISLLIYSLILYSRFLRRVSLVMIIFVILKIFIFDIKILNGNTIVLLLITVGLILSGLAPVIRRIRKKRNSNRRATS
jgi:hypothetical protein